MRTILTAVFIALVASPSLAQQGASPAEIRPPGPTQLVTPGIPAETIAEPNGRDNGGEGADRVIAHSGTGESTFDTDSAAAGNASQPERGVPQSGSVAGDGGS